MATDRLKIYNGALTLCGERSIANLSVNEEGRRLLDEVWDNGGVRYCLEQGQWRFALRTVRMDYDTDVTPEFGYRRAFRKNDDWVVTSALCSDAYFSQPLLRYNDEGEYIVADLDVIYTKYVSDSTDYGNDLSRWPQTFTEFVKAYFAWRICIKLTGDKERYAMLQAPNSEHMGILPQAKRTALNKDAMRDASKFPAQGNWTRARRGTASQYRDGGNRNTLIG